MRLTGDDKRFGLSVFIPVLNEESLLVQNTGRLVEFLISLKTPYEIIIGSNGSTDMTEELAARLCVQHQHVRFFHLPQKGVGRVFKIAVRNATYDRIITIDMDLSTNLDYIAVAYRLLAEYDIVIGSKIAGTQKRSWVRKLASNSFVSLARILLKIDFHDYSTAAKGYRKNFVEKCLPYVDNKTFYVVEILYLAYRDGKKLKEIPVRCIDMRRSRFNLIHEGAYKFAKLFRLWMSSLKASSNRKIHGR
jgi:glycosyltransferase involved in cell wall biosynthesis